MVYLRSGLVGVLTGVMAAVVWAVGRVLIWVWLQRSSNEGGLASTSIGIGNLILPALVGFAVGFFFMFQRR